MPSNKDFEIERERYNTRARKLLNQFEKNAVEIDWGPQSTLFEFARTAIKKTFSSTDTLLEIGAGTGDHTQKLLDSTSNIVVVLDISELSLQVLTSRYGNRVQTVVASMDDMPFVDESFDGVASFGSLSYGLPSPTDEELLRILKKGGNLIVVDTINNLSIYRFKRYINYLLGRRTKSVYNNIPTISRLSELSKNFVFFEIRYFGVLYWLYPFLKLVLGSQKARKVIDIVDARYANRNNCLKFVAIFKSLK